MSIRVIFAGDTPDDVFPMANHVVVDDNGMLHLYESSNLAVTDDHVATVAPGQWIYVVKS